MDDNAYTIVNGCVLTPAGWLAGASLVIRAGRIAAVCPDGGVAAGTEPVDAQGLCVAPGCIDLHVHGGGGADFLEATPEAFRTVAEAHAQYGTTALYATLAVFSPDTFRRAVRACGQVQRHPGNGAAVLGLHLEGNYLNPAMKGGQPPEYISNPDPAEYEAMLDAAPCIKRWSAASELPGAHDFARCAVSRGVLVALAHTTADYGEVKAACTAGFTHATHFYNAMTGVHREGEYKREGTVEGIYLTDEMTVEVIADGIHVPPALLRMAYKFKGAERIALVTDSMAAGAMPEGGKPFDPRVIVEDGVCKLADRSALAGSIATADRLIRTMVREAGVPLEDAVRMASETPARIMGISDRKGTLEAGKDADVILFDDDITVRAVFVGGRRVK